MTVPTAVGTFVAREITTGSVSSIAVPFGSIVVVVVMLVTCYKRVSVCAATVIAKMLSAKVAASIRESILLNIIDGELLFSL